MNLKNLIINLLSSIKKTVDFQDQDLQFENKPPVRRGKLKFLLILPVLLIAVAVIISCQYTVEETEQAVVTTLGKVTSVESAGLHFKLPYPIQGVTKVAVNKTQKLQIGYSSESESDSYL